MKIARKFDYGIRMVTLEGELLVPGGAISGGACATLILAVFCSMNLRCSCPLTSSISRRSLFLFRLEAKRTEESEQSAKVSEWDVEVEKMRQSADFQRQNLERVEGEIARHSAELKAFLRLALLLPGLRHAHSGRILLDELTLQLPFDILDLQSEIARHSAELKEVQEGLHLGKEEVERKKASILEIEKTIASSYSAQTDAESAPAGC